MGEEAGKRVVSYGIFYGTSKRHRLSTCTASSKSRNMRNIEARFNGNE